VDIDPALGERKRNAPGAHGEFERRSGTSVLGEERDSAFCIKRENFWPLVVDIGKAVAESRRSVLLDGPDTTPARFPDPSPPPPSASVPAADAYRAEASYASACAKRPRSAFYRAHDRLRRLSPAV
jgi:hypothetical protein